MKNISIIIISGLSGSGKSTALKTLEDLGFYCVDNLPVLLLPKFIELCDSSSDEISRVALVMDAREGTFLKDYQPTLKTLRDEGYKSELIFLESTDDVLIHRFSETRRQHPLSADSVRQGIALERDQLSDVKSQADRVIDTSGLNVHQLRKMFEEYFENLTKRKMAVTFFSFGFKSGVPNDIDILFDVRFLPNPYFVPDLKLLDGTDERVAGYVLESDESQAFLSKLIDFITFQIPLFEREGKTYLTVAIGCTGGRHRSVAIASTLKDHFQRTRERVHVIHRDIDNKPGPGNP